MIAFAIWAIAAVLFIYVLFHSLGASWNQHPEISDPVEDNIRDDKSLYSDDWER